MMDESRKVEHVLVDSKLMEIYAETEAKVAENKIVCFRNRHCGNTVNVPPNASLRNSNISEKIKPIDSGIDLSAYDETDQLNFSVFGLVDVGKNNEKYADSGLFAEFIDFDGQPIDLSDFPIYKTITNSSSIFLPISKAMIPLDPTSKTIFKDGSYSIPLNAAKLRFGVIQKESVSNSGSGFIVSTNVTKSDGHPMITESNMEAFTINKDNHIVYIRRDPIGTTGWSKTIFVDHEVSKVIVQYRYENQENEEPVVFILTKDGKLYNSIPDDTKLTGWKDWKNICPGGNEKP